MDAEWNKCLILLSYGNSLLQPYRLYALQKLRLRLWCQGVDRFWATPTCYLWQCDHWLPGGYLPPLPRSCHHILLCSRGLGCSVGASLAGIFSCWLGRPKPALQLSSSSPWSNHKQHCSHWGKLRTWRKTLLLLAIWFPWSITQSLWKLGLKV